MYILYIHNIEELRTISGSLVTKGKVMYTPLL